MSPDVGEGETRGGERAKVNVAVVTAHHDGHQLGHGQQENERGLSTRGEGATSRERARRGHGARQREVRQVHRGALQTRVRGVRADLVLSGVLANPATVSSASAQAAREDHTGRQGVDEHVQ